MSGRTSGEPLTKLLLAAKLAGSEPYPWVTFSLDDVFVIVNWSLVQADNYRHFTVDGMKEVAVSQQDLRMAATYLKVCDELTKSMG